MEKKQSEVCGIKQHFQLIQRQKQIIYIMALTCSQEERVSSDE
jgi:predicted transposase YbfD/YdcC